MPTLMSRRSSVEGAAEASAEVVEAGAEAALVPTGPSDERAIRWASPAVSESTEPDPDAVRMMRVRIGDREAFRELYERHASSVTRFAASFLGNAARGEELAQEVFLQLYRTRERYEPRARFSTYLYTIAQNLCRNEVRRPEHRAGTAPVRRAADAPPFDPPDHTGALPGGEALASSDELASRLRQLLAELPEAQRTALILSRSQELRYQEIGEILSCSEQAVKSLIFRATRRLKEGLKEYLEDG